MFAFIFVALVAAQIDSPYDFEVDRGLVLEVGGAAAFSDSSDDASGGGLVRVSYSLANISDSFVAAELEFSQQYIFDSDRLPNTSRLRKRQKLYGSGSILFYEVFNPMAFRLGGGGGFEYRFKSYSPSMHWRGGLGWYMNQDWSLWTDISGKEIYRSNTDDTQYLAGLSLQYIF